MKVKFSKHAEPNKGLYVKKCKLFLTLMTLQREIAVYSFFNHEKSAGSSGLIALAIVLVLKECL